MTWEEYLVLSEKTLSHQFHMATDKQQRVLHACIGICTEAGELLHISNVIREKRTPDQANLREELGDLYWYLAILYREFPGLKDLMKVNDLLKVDLDSTPEYLEHLMITSTELLDLMKKAIYYGKPFDNEQLSQLLHSIEGPMVAIANAFDWTKEEICEININKLKARYGEKFSSDAAINRDLDTERQILED